MVPVLKLADQSPKPLDHRNWPRILFLLDLLTASSLENRHLGRLIYFIIGKINKPQYPMMAIVLSRDINGTRNDGVRVIYFPPFYSLKLTHLEEVLPSGNSDPESNLSQVTSPAKSIQLNKALRSGLGYVLCYDIIRVKNK